MKTLKERALDVATNLLLSDLDDENCLAAVELLREIANAPEPEPVAHATGFYAGYLLMATVDGRVLPAGTALYTAPPHQSEHHLEMARDAERYRWLLKQAWFQQAADRFDFTDGGMQIRFEKCMDEFIDVAIAAEKGGA